MKGEFRPKPVNVPKDQTWWITDATAALAGFLNPEDQQAFADMMAWKRSEAELSEVLADAKAAFISGDPSLLLRVGRAADAMKRLNEAQPPDLWRLAACLAATQIFRETPVGGVDSGMIKDRARRFHRELIPSAYSVSVGKSAKVITDVPEPNWTRIFAEIGLGDLRKSKGGRPRK